MSEYKSREEALIAGLKERNVDIDGAKPIETYNTKDGNRRSDYYLSDDGKYIIALNFEKSKVDWDPGRHFITAEAKVVKANTDDVFRALLGDKDPASAAVSQMFTGGPADTVSLHSHCKDQTAPYINGRPNNENNTVIEIDAHKKRDSDEMEVEDRVHTRLAPKDLIVVANYQAYPEAQNPFEDVATTESKLHDKGLRFQTDAKNEDGTIRVCIGDAFATNSERLSRSGDESFPTTDKHQNIAAVRQIPEGQPLAGLFAIAFYRETDRSDSLSHHATTLNTPGIIQSTPSEIAVAKNANEAVELIRRQQPEVMPA